MLLLERPLHSPSRELRVFTRPRRCVARPSSSSPALRSRTSSGRSTWARRCTCSRTRTSAGGSSPARSGSARSGRSPGAGRSCSPRRTCTSGSAGACGRCSSPSRRHRCFRPRSAATPLGSTRPRASTPGRGGPAAGTVLLERILGGTATLVLAAVGFALAVGRYPVGGYIWLELAFVVLTIAGGFVLFSTRLHPVLRRFRPLLRRCASRGRCGPRISPSTRSAGGSRCSRACSPSRSSCRRSG